MSHIEIRIEGIIVMLFERDPAPPNSYKACVLGIVAGVPRHVLEITWNKNNTGDVPINPGVPRLNLEVENTSQTGIRLHNEQLIDRVTGQSDGGPADPQSASWILEFEGELYPPEHIPIGVDGTKFHPIFRINNGEIFTEHISVNHLLTRSEVANPEEPFTLIGRVATVAVIRIDLDQANSKARLSRGATPIVDVVQGDTLKINVALTCPTCSHTGQQTGHANNYYRALGRNLPFGEKKLFSSTSISDFVALGPPISPEASCLVARASVSTPPGDSSSVTTQTPEPK